MAAISLKIFLGQSLSNQYADLKSAGVFIRKGGRSYKDKHESYTFLGSDFTVYKRSGVVVNILMDCAKVPPLA